MDLASMFGVRRSSGEIFSGEIYSGEKRDAAK